MDKYLVPIGKIKSPKISNSKERRFKQLTIQNLKVSTNNFISFN